MPHDLSKGIDDLVNGFKGVHSNFALIVRDLNFRKEVFQVVNNLFLGCR